MNNQDMLRVAVRDFGKPVIAWACNLSDGQVEQLLTQDLSLQEPQARILGQLVGRLFSIRLRAAVQGFPVPLFLSEFSGVQGSTDRNILNVWREEAGGEMPRIASDDSVINPLQHLALDAYPTLLMAPYLLQDANPGLTLFFSTFSFRHPARRGFENAVLQDDALTLLFPTKGEDEINTYSQVMSSTGRGGTIQLSGLASQVIQFSYALMRIRGGLSVDQLFSSVQEAITILRDVASGREARVPTFVGFNNISLEATAPIQVPWGTLKPYTELFSEFVPSQARPSHTNVGDTDVTLGFVLETSFPYHIAVGPWAPGPSREELPTWPSGMDADREILDHNCRLTALLLSLAIERAPPIAGALAWTMVLDPILVGGSISWNERAYPPVDFFRVRDEHIESIRGWASIITSVDDSKIRIAQRRTLSALTQRHDPVDSFIDAVVAWENLFGAGQGELRFRISASMASLLSDVADERLALQNEISKLYDRRSKVLHGDDLSPESASADRNRALFLVLATLRCLYQNLPHLVANTDRARILILSP